MRQSDYQLIGSELISLKIFLESVESIFKQGGIFMKFYFATVCVFLSGCATPPTFQPEVGGEGAMYSKGGVVFSIPPQKPVLKMKISSILIPKKRAHIRLFFIRKGEASGAFLDPQEQVLLLPNSSIEIRPVGVHADLAGKPMIKLANIEKQAVELIFPLPSSEGYEYPYLTLKWKLHYREGGNEEIMTESERFNIVKSIEPNGTMGASGLSDFPEGDPSMPVTDMWMLPTWAWW